MTKIAKEILLSLGYESMELGVDNSRKGYVYEPIDKTVDQALKELEVLLLEVIGNDTPIDPSALFVLQAEKLAQNELRKCQRNRMRSALYGEEKK